jgi:hypothetical protein
MPHGLLIASMLTILAGVALYVQGIRLRLKLKEPLDPVQPGHTRKMLPDVVFRAAGTFTMILGVAWLIRLVR